MSLANGIKMLTADDLRVIFGIGKNRAYALMHSPSFPSVKIGNRLYVSEDALIEWENTYRGRSFLVE